MDAIVGRPPPDSRPGHPPGRSPDFPGATPVVIGSQKSASDSFAPVVDRALSVGHRRVKRQRLADPGLTKPLTMHGVQTSNIPRPHGSWWNTQGPSSDSPGVVEEHNTTAFRSGDRRRSRMPDAVRGVSNMTSNVDGRA